MFICIVVYLLYLVGLLVGIFAFAGVFDTSRYILNMHTLLHLQHPPLLGNQHEC